ncbi:hypothetical protein BSL78_13292 [Apostichopus japonicus]|uniref:Peptidase aspartic putative domain-containing protein n=1 Tax=Stichopus japonicus TaxID=307972 RepID=A0A2G8KPB3_STIJA|nr:hypothetical protein BSL78_13292 [Apostichopus japonicus]
MILGAMTSKLEKRKTVESSEDLWELIGDLNKCKITLSKLGYDNDLNCSNTLLTVQNLLPIHIQTRWSNASHDILTKQATIGLNDLIKFLEKQASVKSTMFGKQLEMNIEKQNKRRFDQRKNDVKKNENKGSYHTASVKAHPSDPTNCPCCSMGTHKLWRCNSFLAMRVEDRWDYASKNKLCFKCLGEHFSPQCTRRQNAFLDDGSEQTYVNEDLVAELGIHGKPEEVKATVLNGKEERFQSFPVKFDISPLNRPEKQYGIEAITIKNVCGKLKPIDWCRVSRDWDHLKDIEFPKFLGSRNKVDILIGLDHAGLHESIHEVKGRSGEPIARLTPLGYTCVGPVAPAARRAFHTRSVSTFHCTVDREVNITLRKFWEVDNMGLNCKVTCHTKEEEEAIRVVIESMAGGDNCRYQVRIPWKEKERKNMTTNNHVSAKKRLESLEKKLIKDEKLGKAYSCVIQGYLDKGYIRKVDEEEPKSSTEWFIPHFPVVKMDRTTTKVRIVYDASAKDRDLCLNDVINNGPKLQNDLCDVLLRFRRDKVAVVCDISEMYLQIEIDEVDRPMFRFMWRDLECKRNQALTNSTD